MSLLDKYKATSKKTIQDQRADEMEKAGFKHKSMPGYVSFQEGKNILRIFPAHIDEDGYLKGEDTSYIYAKCINMLPISVKQKDDQGNETVEIKMRGIFNPTYHSTVVGKKDLVKKYIDLAEKKFKEELEGSGSAIDIKKKLEEKMNPITGYRAGGKFVSGITSQLSYVCYGLITQEYKGDKTKWEFGRCEIKKGIKWALDKIVLESDDSDGSIATEPFTSPIDGLLVQINYDPNNNNPQKRWEGGLYLQNFMPVRFPLTEGQLEEFEKNEPLFKMFHNSYTRKDFEKQIEGLKNFDTMHRIGVFEDSELQDMIKEIDALLGGADSEEKGEKGEGGKAIVNPLLDFSKEELAEMVDVWELDITIRPSYSVDRVISDIVEEVASQLELDFEKGENLPKIYERIQELIVSLKKGENENEEENENEGEENENEEEGVKKKKNSLLDKLKK